jgi:hypothetical protein
MLRFKEIVSRIDEPSMNIIVDYIEKSFDRVRHNCIVRCIRCENSIHIVSSYVSFCYSVSEDSYVVVGYSGGIQLCFKCAKFCDRSYYQLIEMTQNWNEILVLYNLRQ